MPSSSPDAAPPAHDHAYFRPQGDMVSGSHLDNTAPYHRAPCPALNSLANHGYLPRDGKNLTPEIIKQAMMKVFHLDEARADRLTAPLPPTLSLATLGTHHLIEHDASIVHDDAFFKQDPSKVNPSLVTRLLARADKDQRLGKKEIAGFRREREEECAASNPEFEFGSDRQATSYSEAASLLIAMGDYEKVSISVDDARSFLLEEKFPDTFKRSTVPITTAHTQEIAAQIKAMAQES